MHTPQQSFLAQTLPDEMEESVRNNRECRAEPGLRSLFCYRPTKEACASNLTADRKDCLAVT